MGIVHRESLKDGTQTGEGTDTPDSDLSPGIAHLARDLCGWAPRLDRNL